MTNGGAILILTALLSPVNAIMAYYLYATKKIVVLCMLGGPLAFVILGLAYFFEFAFQLTKKIVGDRAGPIEGEWPADDEGIVDDGEPLTGEVWPWVDLSEAEEYRG